MNISSREFHFHKGKYFEEAISEPVIIEKNGRPSIVIVSYKWYLETKKTMKEAMAKMCECKEPEIYVEGHSTKYYACSKCNKPVSDAAINKQEK